MVMYIAQTLFPMKRPAKKQVGMSVLKLNQCVVLNLMLDA